MERQFCVFIRTSYVNVKGHILLVIPVNLCENHDFVEACLVLQMCVLPVLAFCYYAWKNF